MNFDFEGHPVEFRRGDSVAVALLRNGIHPRGGGCLCLEGDCPNCLVVIDGVAYMRSCQVAASDQMSVNAQPFGEDPPLPQSADGHHPRHRELEADLVVIGQGEAGRRAAAGAAGSVITFEAKRGEEVVGIYAGPSVVARTNNGTVSVRCQRVIVATGAAQGHPPVTRLAGVLTSRAAATLEAAGVDLGNKAVVTLEDLPVIFEGEGRVSSVVTVDGRRLFCDTAVCDFGLHPRSALLRMGAGLEVEGAGDVTLEENLPPLPEEGVICPCSGVSVSDLESVWDRGFNEMELIKRATLAGTGTCQGSVCLPYLKSFLLGKGVHTPAPFTARPLSRQLSMAEAAAGFDHTPFRRTSLYDEHLRLGATMDRFGGWWRPWRYPAHDQEYWSVRERVSLMDVGTLGKFEISGPGAVELLERLYPCRVANLAEGRIRYALLLDERGYVLDDGLICRLSDTRFFLTFTSGGASFAEMWLRDWAESFGLDVRILDRTQSLGAINVTGPLAKELMAHAGLDDPPRYLRHVDAEVAGIHCRVVRLSFTGELSFELHHRVDQSVELWRTLLELGEPLGIYVHGLDTLFGLRLEKGHFIVGMDSEYDSTPRRLGMEWAADLEKGDFVGRQALIRTNRLPLNKRLLGWTMEGPPPIEGSILFHDQVPVGQVTSARYSPVLKKTVMLGWLRGEEVDELVCDGRRAIHTAHPFYDPEGERARA